MAKQRRLTNLKVNEVSLVDDGANQLADIVLAKRNDVETAANLTQENDMEQKPDQAVETTKAATAEDISKQVAAEVEKARAADRAEFQKKLDEANEVAKAAQKRADEAQAAAQVEKDARETLEFTKRAETELPNLPGEAIDKGRVLKAIDSLTDAVKASALAMLKAGDTAMAKSFTVIGKSGSGNGDSAESQLDVLAEKRANEKGISKGVAYMQVMETPEGRRLHKQAQAEKRGVN